MNGVEPMDVGAWIRRARKRRSLSQAKMARLYGVEQAALSAWELGKRPLPTSEARRIEQFFERFDRDLEAGKIHFRKRRYARSFLLSADSGANASGIRGTEYPTAAPELTPPHNGRASAQPHDCQFTAINLFAGIGGFSLGFRQAGFRIVGFVELDTRFLQIYESNFPDTACLGHDIRDVQESEIHEWRDRFGHIHVLFGGPPCQGFSLAGKRDRHDPRNQYYREFARIAAVLRPDVVLMENVRLLTSMRGTKEERIAKEILEDFREAGYVIDYEDLNAQDYGVPQFRERVFFLGCRRDLEGQPIVFPEPTHVHVNNRTLFSQTLKPYVTFRDACGDLERLESGQRSSADPWHFAVRHPDHVIAWLKGVPEGKSAHDNADPSLRPPSGYNTTYKRLKWDEPCSTIGTTFGMISASRNVHPSDTRSITIREALRCQSFPDGFLLRGKLGDIRKGIGNAVPPVLAGVLADHLKKTYLTAVIHSQNQYAGVR